MYEAVLRVFWQIAITHAVWLSRCAENNKRPKFYKFLDYDGNVSVYSEDNGTNAILFTMELRNSIRKEKVCKKRKKESAALNSPRLTAKPLSDTDSTISISHLLDFCQ